jgi:hypothetical protein
MIFFGHILRKKIVRKALKNVKLTLIFKKKLKNICQIND